MAGLYRLICLRYCSENSTKCNLWNWCLPLSLFLSLPPCIRANGSRSELKKAMDCIHSGNSVWGCTLVCTTFWPNETIQYGSDFPLVSAGARSFAFRTEGVGREWGTWTNNKISVPSTLSFSGKLVKSISCKLDCSLYRCGCVWIMNNNKIRLCRNFNLFKVTRPLVSLLDHSIFSLCQR